MLPVLTTLSLLFSFAIFPIANPTQQSTDIGEKITVVMVHTNSDSGRRYRAGVEEIMGCQ